jgi:CelD/BcsL family acetyltransferase involved in cellulose biosynthesis
LLEHTIRQAIAEGRQTLDLLAPRHGYKMDFADGVVLVHDHALALSGRGSLYMHGFLRMRRRLKAVVEALPLPVRQLVARATCRAGHANTAASTTAQAHS